MIALTVASEHLPTVKHLHVARGDRRGNGRRGAHQVEERTPRGRGDAPGRRARARRRVAPAARAADRPNQAGHCPRWASR
eukprot:scaffold61896_cov36-Phaeocystis_antarctica.AAC.1